MPDATIRAAAAPAPAVRVVYDDWTGEGPLDATRWMHPFPLDPAAHRLAAVRAHQLHLRDVPMSIASDDVHDSHKYFATCTRRFALPASGSVMVEADIRALTPGVRPGHVVPATGRALLDAQQAAATLHLSDLRDTGVVFDWFVGERTAFALYERLFVPGVTERTAYTQIVAEVTLGPAALPDGRHRFGIRFHRRPGAPDGVEYLLDGEVVATVSHIGIPIDRQPGTPALPVAWPSLGPGELLGARVAGFEVGVGLFSLLGEFPFNQVPGHIVSIPREQRLFGQGVDATFGPVVVTTTGREDAGA